MPRTFCNENGTINRSAVRAEVRARFADRFNYFFVKNNFPKSHGQPLQLAKEIIRKVRAEASSEQHVEFVMPRYQREVESEYTAAERATVDSADAAANRQPINWIGNQRAKEYGTEAGIVRERVRARVINRIRSEINRAA